MNTLEIKELREVAQHLEECGALMTINPKVVLNLIKILESVDIINTDAAIAELKAQGIDKWIESRNGRWNGTTKEAEEFAANLRAGRKG